MINWSRMVGGRITDIIAFLQSEFQVNSLDKISPKAKLEAICYVLLMTPSQVDDMIADNSPVYRTVKGHVFETVFDHILAENGISSETVGGDTEVDRNVNGYSLQLKTPYEAGSRDGVVAYKTHKTHGSKSEQEGFDYYSKACEFADYLVGLISYNPFMVVILPNAQIPRHPRNNAYIQSPFRWDISDRENVNNFTVIGINNLTIDTNFLQHSSHELLPRTSEMLNVSSRFIIDTILKPSNFRIWDMNMRGFAREITLSTALSQNNITIYVPARSQLPRADKSDFVLQKSSDQTYCRFQVKGLTWQACTLAGRNSIADIETQLSRGRVNDHPTRSRLYQADDFEAVLLCVDPSYVQAYCSEIDRTHVHEWRYYCIPVDRLTKHHNFTQRIASHQRIKFVDLQQYRIDETWLRQWK